MKQRGQNKACFSYAESRHLKTKSTGEPSAEPKLIKSSMRYSLRTVFFHAYAILSHLSDMLSHIPQWHKGCNNVGESHKELKRK